MYSRSITDRDIAALEAALGRPLAWWSVEDCQAINESIAEAWDANGKQIRALTDDELSFIADERFRCQLDALYWLERYAIVRRDDARGGKGLIQLWTSQRIILNHIAYCEERMWESYDRQVAAGIDESMIRVDGILIALLKARQLGATSLILLLLLHLFVFHTNLREVFASAEGTKTLEGFELYFVFPYQHLPVWMRPQVETKSKDFGMRCETQDTTLFLQNAAQETGIGMGGTTHAGLITEVGLYPKSVTEQMQNHFFRSVPYSLVTFIVLESLAQGQGNFWHAFALNAIKGGDAAGRWHGVFIPWYTERGKYRLEPPAGWKPSEQTLKYAYQVYLNSHKYVGEYREGKWYGITITLDAYQLYWYERERIKAEIDGALEDFLTNYPATPEEAFQSRGGSPFGARVLQRLSNDCRDPIKQFEWLDRGPRPADLTFNPDDERGLIRIYKKPERNRRYKMGVDTAPGIDGWSRRMPQSGDRKKDNMAIEIIEVGTGGKPDEQVAEFVAPIDYVAGAPIVNWLGRLYRGLDEDMCECVVETGPTSGEALQERLLNEYGYYNLYRKANMATYTHATSFGWVPNERTRLELWYRTRPHISFYKRLKVGTDHEGKPIEIEKVKFIARSRYLVDTELRNCEIDRKLMTAKAAFGFHDDATRGIQMAIYIAHDWQHYGEASEAEAEGKPREVLPDYQASALTRAEMNADVDRRREELVGGDVW